TCQSGHRFDRWPSCRILVRWYNHQSDQAPSRAMSKTYAIADLHGRLDLLEMALAKIADDAEPPTTLVTLGDYVDRGPDSRQVIERLMAGLGPKGWRLISLKGNHEDIMWQTCRRKVPDCGWWLTNGGGATLISYGQNKGDEV